MKIVKLLNVLINQLTDQTDLRIDEESVTLSNLSIYYKCRNIKGSCNNNQFKKSAPTWNDGSKLPDESYWRSNILRVFWLLWQDYFEYV